jgi:glutamyl-tRNA reductase
MEEGRAARERAARDAQHLVEREADRFLESLRQIDINDDLRQLAAFAEEVRQVELERSRKLVGSLDEQQLQALDAMTRALVKKLLHRPMMAVRSAAREGDTEKVETLMEPWKEQ